MGNLPRSPLLGYNHNVRYHGRIFHVQTEDSGPTNPHLFTHLYYGGTILASKRHEYDREASEDLVRTLMQGQHKQILKELKQARFDERIDTFFATQPNLPEAEPEPLTEAYAVEETPEAPVVQAAPTLDLDALPTPAPVSPTAEAMEPLPAAPPARTSSPGLYAMKGNTQDRPFDEAPAPASSVPPPPLPGTTRRLRPDRPPPTPGAPVVVQRNVVVGGSTTPPPVSVPARVRRPAQPVPYVVKEGSHPTASPVRSASAPALPPARPMAPPPPNAAHAPRTSGVPPQSPPAELISDKSLDEVILAYLSQGDDPGR